MDPRKRLQVLQQSSPSIRVAAAPKTAITSLDVAHQGGIQVGNQTINQDPNAVSGVAPKARPLNSSIPIGLARGTSQFLHDTTDILPQAIGQLKALTPKPLDPIADKVRAAAQTLSDVGSGYNATNAILSENGGGVDKNGNLLDKTAQKIATPARVGFNTAAAALGAAEIGKQVLTKGPTVFKNATSTLSALRTGGAAAAKEQASINRSVGVAGKLGVDANLLHSLKSDNDVSSVLGKLIDAGHTATPELIDTAKAIAGSKNAREIGKALVDLPLEAGAAAGGAAFVSDALAKERYGNSPLTGEQAPAPIDLTPPLERIPLDMGGGAPTPGLENAPQQGIPLTNTALDTPLSDARIEEALRGAGVQPTDIHDVVNEHFATPEQPAPNFSERLAANRAANQTTDLSEAIKSNLPKVSGNQELGQALQDAYLRTGIHDPYNLLVNAIAGTDKKSVISSIVDELVGATEDTNMKNRLTKKLTSAETPDEVHAIIDAETARANTPQAPVEAPVTPPEQGTVPTTEQLAQSAPNEGAVAPEIAQDGSTVKTEALTPDQKVSETVNKNADQTAAARAAKAEKYVPTGLGEKQNALKRAALSVNGELEQYGEGGKAISGANKKAIAVSEQLTNKFTDQIPSVMKLKNKQVEEFANALEAFDKGETNVDVSPEVEHAIKEWVAAIPQVRAAAEEHGLDVGDLGKFYFPRRYSELLKNKDSQAQAINHLVKTGQADNTVEARQMLQYAGNDLSQQFGNLEKSRKFDLPGYDKNKETINSYIIGAFNRIGQASQFGAKGEKAAGMIDQSTREGFDGKRVEELYKVANRLETSDHGAVEVASQKLQSFNRLRSLGLAAITNATQVANTVTKGGLIKSIRGFAKTLSPEERQFVHESGVVSKTAIHDLQEGSGLGTKITGKLTAPFFNRIETFNRTHAALTGKLVADTMAARGDAKGVSALRSLGVEGDIGETLTHEQQVQAARGFVEATQFKVNPQDLPRWASTPAGKLVSQFRTFSYKQTKFIYDEVLKEAAKGNILPLVRYTTVGAGLGYASAQAKGVIQNQIWSSIRGKDASQKPTQSAVQKYVNALQSGGGFGLVNDVIFDVQNRASGRFPEYVAGSLAGPSASLAVGTAMDAQKAFAGDKKPIERRAIGAIPIIGKGLANTLLPYKAQAAPDKTKNKTDNVPADTIRAVDGTGLADVNGKPIFYKNKSGKLTEATKPNGTDGKPVNTGNKLADKLATDKAIRNNLGKAYDAKLGAEDSALVKTSPADLKSYLDKGDISQQQYDHAIKLHTAKSDYIKTKSGLPDPLPDGIKPGTPEAKFYDKYNTLVSKDQAEFIKHGNSDPSAKAVVDELNADTGKPSSVPVLGRANNQLAKQYADYKADLEKNKNNYTDVDLQNKAKAFWTGAIKTQYDSVAQDLYSEGNSKDYKALVAEGKITKPQLDQAIKLDNALYQTGFVGLKFGKKFRDAAGYAIPSKTADGKTTLAASGGGSGGGSGKTTNAHLTELLPSANMGGSNGSAIPKFSARSRNLKLKSNISLPQGSSKKVTIKL